MRDSDYILIRVFCRLSLWQRQYQLEFWSIYMAFCFLFILSVVSTSLPHLPIYTVLRKQVGLPTYEETCALQSSHRCSSMSLRPNTEEQRGSSISLSKNWSALAIQSPSMLRVEVRLLLNGRVLPWHFSRSWNQERVRGVQVGIHSTAEVGLFWN